MGEAPHTASLVCNKFGLFICALHPHWESRKILGGGDGPMEGGFGRRGGGDAFSFNFNLSNASLVLGHKNHGGT